MIRNIKYVPVIKTGDAELRAIESLSSGTKDKVFPLFELTRGRKSKKDTIGETFKRLNKLKEIFPYNPFFLDLTSDEELTNDDIKSYHCSDEGYLNWCNFCIEQKSHFTAIYPVIQIEEEEEAEDENDDAYSRYILKMKKQFDCLLDNFDFIAFRSQDENTTFNLIADIEMLAGLRVEKGYENNFLDRIIFIIDFNYINDSVTGVDSAILAIEKLHQIGISNIIISSTSFPSSVSELMDKDDRIAIPVKEFKLFDNIKQKSKDFNVNLIYSDYATVHPLRNDNVKARGWIPRIDVPYKENIYSIRKKRDKADYSDRYEEIAQQVIKTRFFNNISNEVSCWGLDEIEKTARGYISGSSPRFWIAVRMNIHINSVTDIMLKIIY